MIDPHSPRWWFAKGAKRRVRRSPVKRHDLFAPLLVADRVLGVVAIQAEQLGAFAEKAFSIFRSLNTDRTREPPSAD